MPKKTSDTEKWMAKLQTLEGVKPRRNVHSTVIQSGSPSLDFTFAKGWGLPRGYSIMFYGPPKSGKSLLTYMMAAKAQQDYPDSFVIKFDTEYRDQAQLDDNLAAKLGLDLSRYVAIQSNHPAQIYDQMDTQIAAWLKEGMPVSAMIIDSMSGVQGRRGTESESVMKTQIGDVALTNKEGLKRVLKLQRDYDIGLMMTSHVTPEMDPIEQKRGNKYKMGASVGVQHHAEYFMYVERNANKAGRADLLEREFKDEQMKDADGQAEQTAGKIWFCMKDSSFGQRGRHGELTWSFDQGLINTHEEVFLLGTGRGVIERPNPQSYVYGGNKWVGKANFLEVLAKDKEMQAAVLRDLREMDVNGKARRFDEQDAKAYGVDLIGQELAGDGKEEPRAS